MKAILQRVREASVDVDGQTVGRIGPGLLVLAGFTASDDRRALEAVATKMVNLRIFEDNDGKMNLSLLETGGGLLVVSQFTLYADCRKGRRPSFMNAAPPDQAKSLYEEFVGICRSLGPQVETGIFAAMMEVRLNNWGPVTITLDSDELA
ncbi:MAG: D-tyrosyl-tRNA(Tyr) deacylase [Candidatus Sumerlaeaceae bacterium]|nr:D-tyrosyl-tRNA(Tyr) deacylase [Candidatus Sumerlaeaceae bacterium]